MTTNAQGTVELVYVGRETNIYRVTLADGWSTTIDALNRPDDELIAEAGSYRQWQRSAQDDAIRPYGCNGYNLFDEIDRYDEEEMAYMRY